MSSVGIDIILRSQMAGALAAENALDRVGKSADKATGATGTLERQMKSTSGAADLMGRAIAGAISVMAIQKVTGFSDKITTLETQIKNVTRSTVDYTNKFNALYQTAQRTGDVFTGLSGSFVRLNTSLPDSIRYTTDLVKVTELLSRGFAASGTEAQAASGAMIQLTQGLAGNFESSAQELNSIIEAAPLLARVIAEQLGGKAATDLKRFAEQGKLTAESFLEALLASENAISAFEIPPTIGRSWERIQNTIVRVSSESATFEVIANGVASSLDVIANNVEHAVSGIGILSGVIAGKLITSLISSTSVMVAKRAATAATAQETLKAALAYREGAIAATLMAQANREATGSMVMARSAAINLAGANSNVAAAQKAVAASTITMRGAFSGVLALMGGWPGIILAAVAAVITFRKEIADLLGITSTFGDVWNTLWEDRINNSINRAIDRIEKFKLILKGAFTVGGLDNIDEQILLGIDQRIAAADKKSNTSFEELLRRRRIDRLNAENNAAYNDYEREDRIEDQHHRAQEKETLSKEALKEIEKRHKSLQSAIKASRTEEERLLDAIKEMESLRGIAKAGKEAQQLETAINRANKELDDLRVKAERNGAVAKAFESLANQIDDGFRDAFRTAFTESDGGWKSLLNGWKNTFKTFLADLAYMAVARPVVISMVGAVGGMMGVSSGAQAGILGDITGTTGAGGGSFGMGNIGTIGKALINGGLYSSTLGGVGVKMGNVLSGNAMNAIAWDGSFAHAMGGAFGNLGYGALGSMGASLLGLGGGVGGMAGGTIGSLAGGAVGTSMGTILGFAGGPIGAIAGGFLGSALGGLFGGKKPSDKGQWGGINLSDLSQYGVAGMTGKKFSQQNADFRDAVLGQAGGLAQLLQSVGGATSGQVYIHVGSRDGLRLNGQNGQQNFGNNSEAFIEAVLKRVVNQTTGLSDTFQTILNKVGVRDTQKLAEGFEFGKYYESIINPVDAVEEAIKAVNAQFDALAKQARDLGLSSAVFTEKLGEQRQAQLDLIKAQQAGFQSLEAMKSTFDSWLYDQSIGSTSTLSPIEKLMAAQGNFGGILEAVRSGEVSRTQELLQAGQQLLQIGQSMYASSVSFDLLEKSVRDSIGSIAKQLGVPGYASGTRSARAGLAWVGERGKELVNFSGGERVYNAEESKMIARQQMGNDARFAEMSNEIAAMRSDIANMTRQLGRVANQMIVTGGKK